MKEWKASNGDISAALGKIAEILSFLGENVFRVRAYERASQTLTGFSDDLGIIYERGGLPALKDIPGIGEDLANKIVEMLETGKLQFLRDLEKKVPSGILDLMNLEGVGPKKAHFLYEKFRVKNIQDLESVLESGKLSKEKGWGSKTEENIRRAIQIRKKFGERMPLGTAWALADTIVEQLKKSKLCKKVEVAGSLRRMRDTVHDLDILVTSDEPERVIDLFTRLPLVQKVTASGETKATVFLSAGIEADLRVVEPESFGAALYYFTGSKAHNVAIRTRAVKAGITMNEYGVYRGTKAAKGKLIAAETEEDVFKAVGLPYIEPELREDRGEIEAALRGELPKLISYQAIKGDLHLHSNVSDGADDMAAMAAAAKKKGLEYIAFTDHASRMGMVRGIKDATVNDYLKKIEAVRSKVRGIEILAGTEVDIEQDGSLYLDPKALRKLDWVVASVHSQFKLEEAKMTERLVKAVLNPLVDVLGHPSTRLLPRRPPVEARWNDVFKAAHEGKTALEMSASMYRLDLDDVHARAAHAHQCKFAINSDAHAATEFDWRFGIGQARRAWLSKADVINALPWDLFSKRYIRRK